MGRWKRAQGQLRNLLPQLAFGKGAAIAGDQSAQCRGVIALGSAAHRVDQLDLRLQPGDALLWCLDRGCWARIADRAAARIH